MLNISEDDTVRNQNHQSAQSSIKIQAFCILPTSTSYQNDFPFNLLTVLTNETNYS